MQATVEGVNYSRDYYYVAIRHHHIYIIMYASSLSMSGIERRRGGKISQNMIGLIKLRIVRGVNLAVRDYFKKSSDPYVIVRMGKQKLKTRVMKRNVNPEWNQDMTLVVEDTIPIIKFEVYDKDTFSRDDPMGRAELDIHPFVGVAKTSFDGTTMKKLTPNRQNCLAEESSICWSNGKVVQDVVLRLRDVKSGLIELHLEWVTIPGIRGSSMLLSDDMGKCHSFAVT